MRQLKLTRRTITLDFRDAEFSRRMVLTGFGTHQCYLQEQRITRCSRRRQTSPPVPPPGELDKTYASSLILLYLVHYKSMTSSTKLEIHNALHCRQRTTEPRPLVTLTENLVISGHAVFEIYERTDKQISRQIDRQTNIQTL